MIHDLRYALRHLVKTPRFTLIAVSVLALAIAGNVVVFSLVNGLFIRPLPFPQPEQLVDIDETAPQWNLRYVGINYDDFEAWRRHNQTFAGMATWRSGEFSFAAGQRSARLPGQRVTHDLAEVFGVRPVVGRMFHADEELRGGPKVALIGHHIWTEWFGGDPATVGSTVTIDAEPYEIIGVLPPTAVVPSRAALWLPFESKPPYYGGSAVGRLKPGVTIEQAAADLLRIHRARVPESKDNEITSPIVQPLLRRYLGDADRIAVVLQSAVLVLLLIACANVAGLMLARTLVRAPELGLRAALGASRLQLVRQLMTESLLLASIGGAVGVLLGRWALAGVLTLFEDLPAWIQLQMDWRFVLFICAAVALCATVAGLIPARSVLRRLDVRSVLGPGAQQATASGHRLFSLRALVVGEIGLALMLLLVAGLFGRAFLRVMQIDPGIRPEGVLTYGLLLPEAKYRSRSEWLAFFDEHLARLRALPDVQSASASTILPFSGQHIGNFLEPEGGLPGGPDAKPPVILTRMSFPGYFETIGIPLRAGRSFDDRDRSNVIVNETLARLYWPTESAVGKRLRTLGGGPWLDVIGVAGDVRHYGLEHEIRPGIYVPFYAMPQSFVGIVIRTKGDPLALAPDVRSLLKEQDPTLPVAGLSTMEERIGQSLFLRRAYSSLTAMFALVALAMAMTGLYGVIAYVVGSRTREFGVRLALGAQARDLLQAVVREGVRLAVVGIGIGIVAGALAGLTLRPLLMGISPLDPLVLLSTTTLLVTIVLAACLAPAIRATRLNAVDVLRAE
jgi:putative ABC transport system permease protein